MGVKPSPPDRPCASTGPIDNCRLNMPDISDGDHLHRAGIVPEGFQELPHPLSQDWVPEPGRDLVKRLEDKTPFVESRVGYHEICRGDDLLIEKQEVKIHRARTPSGAPHSTAIALNGEEVPKQTVRIAFRLHQGNPIDEAWLICDAHGLRLVQGGDSHQPAPGKGGETREGLPACGQSITQIGAETDIGLMDCHGAPDPPFQGVRQPPEDSPSPWGGGEKGNRQRADRSPPPYSARTPPLFVTPSIGTGADLGGCWKTLLVHRDRVATGDRGICEASRIWSHLLITGLWQCLSNRPPSACDRPGRFSRLMRLCSVVEQIPLAR